MSGASLELGLDVATEHFAQIAVPVPLRHPFTYRIPPSLAARVVPGARVAVPFGPRKVPGIVLSVSAVRPDAARLRDIAGVLDAGALFPAELLAFLVEAAEYYLHPIGEVLRAAAPALPTEAIRALARTGFVEAVEELGGAKLATRRALFVRRTATPLDGARLGTKQERVVQRLAAEGELTLEALREDVADARAVVRALVKRGLAETEERDVLADPYFQKPVERDAPRVLNAAQRLAADAITGALRAREVRAFLLQGVTGSGKTEVYLHAIAEARALGRGALVLVPEIALTPQLVGRFRARFGDSLAVLHSGLGDRERNDAWRALRAGIVTLAVGARSALLAPVADLGIVIVDEEHDASFKQEEGFRYQARDLALLRAHRAGAVCVLGSATPSLETRNLCDRGRVTRLVMPDRATPKPLPVVEVVDLTKVHGGPSGHPLLSGPLHRAIGKCLAEQGQAILFLNRRGFSPSLCCSECGHVLRCPACSVALTEHRRAGALRCHYCDFSMPITDACPACGQLTLERIGIGTERLEDALTTTFAPARVGRLDRDVASGAGVEEVLDRFRARELDILVGTQMVTKGHDLPGVTLVGIILADQSLAFPDFRASERTFQLLAQVAGRAGRGDVPGRVVLQTHQPDHPAVRFARAHDFEGFYAAELEARRELGYAPFSRLVAVRVDALDEVVAREVAEALAHTARAHPETRRGGIELLGPTAAPIARVRGRYRFRFFLRGRDRARLRAVARAVCEHVERGIAPARATVDIDPVAML